MITLAAGGGDYIFLVVMLVFGLINWLANKVKEGKAAAPPPDRPATRPSAGAPPSADPEAERMRRFLEALGVPGDPRETPAPPVSRSEPVAPRPLPPPLPEPEHYVDDETVTSHHGERHHIPELQTERLSEYQTVSSRVAADPDGEFVTLAAEVSAIPHVAPAPDLAAPTREGSPTARSFYALLRSHSDVRTAIVLREILGPPRSLQR